MRLLTGLRASSEREVSDVLTTRADDVRLVVAASYAPVDQLALSLELPLALRRYRPEGLQSRTVFGLGDVEAGARLLLFADRPFAAHHTVGLRATLRMPTGPRLSDDVKHQPVAHDAQPGSGAWSPSVGAWYTFTERLISVFASLDLHRPGIGFDALQLGPAVRAGATVQLQPRVGVAVRVGVDARVAGPTTSSAGATLAADRRMAWDGLGRRARLAVRRRRRAPHRGRARALAAGHDAREPDGGSRRQL